MGLLSLGTPLHWDECRKYADHVRQHGIIQLLNIMRRLQDRQHDVLLWGDEVCVRQGKNRKGGRAKRREREREAEREKQREGERA